MLLFEGGILSHPGPMLVRRQFNALEGLSTVNNKRIAFTLCHCTTCRVLRISYALHRTPPPPYATWLGGSLGGWVATWVAE